VDYFTGEQAEYAPQFFEAYAHYNRHILAIPGNHDGAGQDQLASFMRYFCDTEPRLLPEVSEYGRDTMTQPNCYWTLLDPCVTIVGLYTNVPSGGVVEQDQVDWLVGELKAAPAVPLVVAMHHPPLSVDAHHGGSQRMWDMLDHACQEAGRHPQLVLAGHVHDSQLFMVAQPVMAFAVSGNGGYHNLHALAADAEPGLQVMPGVSYEHGEGTNFGYLRVDATADAISGEFVEVTRAGEVLEEACTFHVPV
jgi:hypothetical protein